MATKSGRVISAERSKDWKQIIIKWEVVLFLIFICYNGLCLLYFIYIELITF